MIKVQREREREREGGREREGEREWGGGAVCLHAVNYSLTVTRGSEQSSFIPSNLTFPVFPKVETTKQDKAAR